MNKITLEQLYAQKGNLITEIEIMQQRLQTVNQYIAKIKNLEFQQQQKQEVKDEHLE